MGRFWDSEANKFTVYGALFGFLFPVIATFLEAMLQAGVVSWEAILTVQRSDPLLWIIDSAPFWLGIFARFAGRRQDYLKRLIRESGRDPNSLPQQTEDAGQFAGTLTTFGLALIAVVLLGLGMWIQNLIVTRLPPDMVIMATATPASVGNRDVSNGAAAPNRLDLVETSNVAGAANPIVLIATPTEEPVVLVGESGAASLSTPEPLAISSETLAITVDNTPVSPTLAPATAIPPTESSPVPVTDPSMQRVRLGYLEGNSDCLFFSQLAAFVWPQNAGVDVELQAFAGSDALFTALTAADHPQHIDLTLCFLDPENRTYFQQYVSAIQVMGKAFWKGETYSLLAVADARSAYLIKANQPCLYNLIRNQSYADPAVVTLDPARWAAENRETLEGWASCANS